MKNKKTFSSLFTRKKDTIWQISELQQKFPGLKPKILENFLSNYGYVMPLSLLYKLDQICQRLQPKIVVEFGSGLSTVVISEASYGHELFHCVFEEDVRWLLNTHNMLWNNGKSESLSNLALVYLPGDTGINHDALNGFLKFTSKPDLVIIDGPSGGGRFSQNAFVVYKDLLTPSSICVVDDTDREDNNLGAIRLAEETSLQKYDYSDPIYKFHRYSILWPADLADRNLL